MKRVFIGFSVGVAIACLFLIIILATGLWKRILYPNAEEQQRTRIVTPREINLFPELEEAQQLKANEDLDIKVPLEEGEKIISMLVKESEEGLAEEQFVLYYLENDAGKPVHITSIALDEEHRRYKRTWSAATSATRPDTTSLFLQDLIGDRGNCVVVTGMNGRNEHTMTIFRPESQSRELPYKKIAELQIDGSIVVQETERSMSYQQGITRGQSFNIMAYGHDSSSTNILDQLEIIYSYSPQNDQYERTNISRIPGSQIEQRRLRELLSGSPGVFENFVNDLWYYVSPQGTIDAKQYIYFNSSGKEIIFFGDETQQVFQWQNSMPTRYGIYITSQNISISTLRRRIDIELISLDSIKLRVSEDVRLKITVSASWDGSYRRARAANLQETRSAVNTSINALYDSSWGRLQFHDTGEYTLSSGGVPRRGRYVFFKADESNLLELRPEDGDANAGRMVYKVETQAGNSHLVLARVRLGTSGIQDMLEPPVTLAPVEN
jgi:hypothetical protein